MKSRDLMKIIHKKLGNDVLVIMGNPPYNSSSQSDYDDVIEYKYCELDECGFKIKLNEKNIKATQDQYVKFIRMAQNLIERQGAGIAGIITANNFIDAITLRGMRWSLLNSFDEIYIYNLHGNSRKQEKTPDGADDKNIFNIMTGVCISFFVRTEGDRKVSNTPQCRVFVEDVWGSRASKYEFLNGGCRLDASVS